MYYDIKESGKRIKELRKKAGMTQEGLANRLNMSTVAVSNMERGVNGVCEGDDGIGKIML